MIKKNCEHYPCHKEELLGSCDYCYCPVYPCMIENIGGKLYKGIWDCSDCVVLHNTKNVEFIKDLIKRFIKKEIT